MAIGSVMSSGVQGMLASQQSMTESANKIAQASTKPAEKIEPTQDLAEPAIQMKVDKLMFDASAKVVKTADETVGSLIDITA